MYSIIPVEAVPKRSFSCVIPVDGANKTLNFKMTYNELADYWLCDISDSEKILISALPFLSAENILEQFKYLEIGSAYLLPQHNIAEDYPTYSTLNSEWYLVWGDTDG